MPVLVKIAGTGEAVRFPDSMSYEEIDAAVKRLYPRTEPEPAPTAPNAFSKTQALAEELRQAQWGRFKTSAIEAAAGIGENLLYGANPAHWPEIIANGVRSVQDAFYSAIGGKGDLPTSTDTARMFGEAAGPVIERFIPLASPDARLGAAKGLVESAASLVLQSPEFLPVVAAGAGAGQAGRIAVGSKFATDLLSGAVDAHNQANNQRAVGDTEGAAKLDAQAIAQVAMAGTILGPEIYTKYRTPKPKEPYAKEAQEVQLVAEKVGPATAAVVQKKVTTPSVVAPAKPVSPPPKGVWLVPLPEAKGEAAKAPVVKQEPAPMEPSAAVEERTPAVTRPAEAGGEAPAPAPPTEPISTGVTIRQAPNDVPDAPVEGSVPAAPLAKGEQVHAEIIEGPTKIGIVDLRVAPEAQSKGAGSEVLQEAMALADKTRKPVRVTAHADSPEAQSRLNRFYESNDFRQVGEDPVTGKPIYEYRPPEPAAPAAEPGKPYATIRQRSAETLPVGTRAAGSEGVEPQVRRAEEPAVPQAQGVEGRERAPGMAVGAQGEARPAVEAAKPTAPAAKEPWQMTRQEYAQAYIEQGGLFGLGQIPIKPAKATPKGVRTESGTFYPYKKLTGIGQHRFDIEQALREGKTVPPEVLADYPDLAKQTKPTAPAPAEATGGRQGTMGALGGTTLTPSQTPPGTLPPKSQRQIIADLAKGLKLPIRFGRLTTSKYAGYFKPIANLIGAKRAVDVPVVSHEIGHKLDTTFRLSDNPTIRSELDVLGDPGTAGSRSSWTPSKSRKYKTGEGTAEFIRRWLTDPVDARNVAPHTFTEFVRVLDANKDVGDVMRQAQDDIRVWREAPSQARLESHINIGDNPNQTRYTLGQLTRDLVDDLHFLRVAVSDAEKALGRPLDPSRNPYLAARNLRGSYGMADTFVRHGTVDFKTKKVALGTSLQDALKPVAGRIRDFRAWIVAKRAQEKIAQGKETGLVKTDVDDVAQRFDGDQDFQTAFSKVKAWQDSLLKYAVDAGLITPDSAAAMRDMNRDYVPFHRLFEVGAGEPPATEGMGIGRGLNVGTPGGLRRFRGSTREIVDPLETMVKNAYAIVTAAEKSAINTSVADLANAPGMGRWVERVANPKERIQVELDRVRKELEEAGADLSNVQNDLLLTFYRPGYRAPFGENIIKVRRGDRQEFYRLNEDLYRTFEALDYEDSGRIWRVLASPAQVLRAGVTLEPSFSIANVLRDTISAAVISKYRALPFETSLRGIAAMIGKPELVAEWAASGGKQSIEASYFDRAKLQRFLTERITKDLTPSERALIWAKSPLTALRWLTSTFEEATRIGEYEIAYNKLRKGGMPEGEARRMAAFEARDRQDFAKGGARTKVLRLITPFANANLQANVRLAQAFRQYPVRTALQGLAYVTTAKLIEQAINWDDPDYWARRQWERDLFFLIPIGKDKTGHTSFLRVPTPFEVGLIFGTVPGRLMQWYKQRDPQAAKGLPELVLKQTVPNPIPPTVQLLFEDFMSGKTGWDIWRGRQIVPEGIAELPPGEQFTEQTSRLAKHVGKLLNFSPMKVDHIIERTTGGMGKLISGRQVPGQRFVTASLVYSNQATEDFYEILGKLEAEKKLTGKQPAGLDAFRAASKDLSRWRKQAMDAKDVNVRLAKREMMFKKASGTVEKYRKSRPLAAPNVGR